MEPTVGSVLFWIITRIVSDFFLTNLPRAFHEKAGRCQGDKVILWSGVDAASQK